MTAGSALDHARTSQAASTASSAAAAPFEDPSGHNTEIPTRPYARWRPA